jgi:DNA-binding transcriptional ArsR family regulator
MRYAFLVQAAAAIADPVRREILELLHARAEPAGEIASRFTISRPAVSRHLRVLREAGLVRDELVGRQRVYSIDPAPLREVARWIGQFERPVPGREAWERRFDALETEVARTRRQHNRQSAEQGSVPGITEETA